MPEKVIRSEAGIIEDYFAPLAAGFAGAYGLRDDCAVIAPPPGHELVVTTDPVRAGLHFFADDAPADIAWKALAVNLSDLAAKGAQPLAYMMALSLPKAPEETWLRAFADGLRVAQERFAMHLIGGDTDRADGPMTIAITMFGTVPLGRMVQRGTAHIGDLLFVSGTLGDSGIGLAVRRDSAASDKLGLSERASRWITGRYMRPEPRSGLALILRDHANAAMDLSDGLMKDLERMCRASGTGARVKASHLPFSRTTFNVLTKDPKLFSSIVSAGDDYEILAAVAPSHSQAFCRKAADAGVKVTQIGKITGDKDAVMLDIENNPVTFEHKGWDHF